MSVATTPDKLDSIAAAANAFCAAHGIQVERHDNDKSSYFQTAPISLLPNAYPADAFAQAQTLAAPLNILVDKIAQDATFLQSTLGGSVADVDPFTAHLLHLYHAIYVDTATSCAAAKTADRMGILRSDYMLHRRGDKYCIQQVELNTIAASFGGLSCQVAKMHSYLVQRFGKGDNNNVLRDWFTANQKRVGTMDSTKGHVPVNPTLEQLPAAMNVALERYKERFGNKKDVVILFVVQEGETNTVDQRLLEFRLFDMYQIPVVRMSLRDIDTHVTVTDDGALLLDDDMEIGLVYFRAGYAPTDYPEQLQWSAREKLERSRATKCPNLGYHLAGTKKVQQQLARPSVVEEYLPIETATAVRSAFAGLYSLGDDATEGDLEAVRQVLHEKKQGNYVLKPQREGGGYNYYGEQLLEKMQQNVTESGSSLVLDKSLGEYILMERLFPPEQQAILMRDGCVEGTGDSVSELGCFGTIVVAFDGEVVHNEYAGFLLRTKFSNVDEGGVASGFATLSSPYLC